MWGSLLPGRDRFSVLLSPLPTSPVGGRLPRSAFDPQYTMMLGGKGQESCKDRGSCWGQGLRLATVCMCEKIVLLRSIRASAVLRAHVVLSFGRFSDPKKRLKTSCGVDRERRLRAMWARRAREDFIASRSGTRGQMVRRGFTIAEGAKSDREAATIEKTSVRLATCTGKIVLERKGGGRCPPPFPKSTL